MDNDTTRRRRRRGWRARGAAAPEYAIVLSLFAVVIIASLGSLEDTARDEFANDADCVGQRPPPTTCQLSYLETTTTALGGGGGSSTTVPPETTTTSLAPPTTTSTTTTIPPSTTSSVPGSTTTTSPPPPDAEGARGTLNGHQLSQDYYPREWRVSMLANILTDVGGIPSEGALVRAQVTVTGYGEPTRVYERTCTTNEYGRCRVGSAWEGYYDYTQINIRIISVDGGNPPVYLQWGDDDTAYRPD